MVSFEYQGGGTFHDHGGAYQGGGADHHSGSNAFQGGDGNQGGGAVHHSGSNALQGRLVLILAGAVCYIFICFWYISTVS
jgi:hypothetical protein